MMEDWDFPHDPAEMRRRKEAQQVARAKLEGVVRSLAESSDGTFFLRWLLSETGALQEGYVADERLSVWNAGRRSVGLQIFSLCAAVNCADKVVSKQEQDNG